MMESPQIIQLPKSYIDREQWREAGWKLLSACLRGESTRRIENAAGEYWASVRRMRAQ